MKYLFLSIIVFVFCFSCKNNDTKPELTKVSLETIYEDSISIRAILLEDNYLWFSGNNGKYGKIDLSKNVTFKERIVKDTLQLEFRSIAQTKEAVFILSVANPALLYKINKDNLEAKLVYTETNEKVFYDSMQFLDDKFGVAMGDPIANCLNIIITNDGGNSWQKAECSNLPKVEEGEAAFAASNSNLILKGNKIFMVSGGKKSRYFVSEDKGNSWKVYATPIVQGETMTGIFTADFYDENIGFIAGGNYEKQEDNSNNKALTLDGGKTWQLMANKQGFGYASCVQFVPNSNGNALVCVGGTGLFYSNDKGANWKKLLEDKDLLTIRFQNDTTAYATGKNRIVQLVFN
uniref:oxidoreductase n=1 Tax=Flavobacterium sp. TaxID=239 RepID=UPI00404B4530